MRHELRSVEIDRYDWPSGVMGVHGTGDRGLAHVREYGILPGQTHEGVYGDLGDVFFFPKSGMFKWTSLPYRAAVEQARGYGQNSAQAEVAADALDIAFSDPLFSDMTWLLIGIDDPEFRDMVMRSDQSGIARYMDTWCLSSHKESYDRLIYHAGSIGIVLNAFSMAYSCVGHVLFLDARAIDDYSFDPDETHKGAAILYTGGCGLGADYLYLATD